MTGPSLSVHAPALRVRRGLVQASVGHTGKTETRVKSHFSNSLSQSESQCLINILDKRKRVTKTES